MVSFHIAAAWRRWRRRRGDAPPPARTSLPRLLLGEAAHVVSGVGSPRVVVVVSGLLATVGNYVALGPDYPGLVVLAEVARVALSVGVLVGTAFVARTVPVTWGAVARGLRRTRLAVLAAGLAGLLSLAKVGLHEATPGPALPASARWGMVTLGAILSLVWSLDRHRSPHP